MDICTTGEEANDSCFGGLEGLDSAACIMNRREAAIVHVVDVCALAKEEIDDEKVVDEGVGVASPDCGMQCCAASSILVVDGESSNQELDKREVAMLRCPEQRVEAMFGRKGVADHGWFKTKAE